MTKAFTKGQEVTYISDWDRKGTVTFRQAIVYSCGKKQMVLTDAETGEEMGRHFSPEVGSMIGGTEEKNGILYQRQIGGTFPRMTDEEARIAGLQVAKVVLEDRRAHYARCLASGHGESYNNAIRADLAKLHEPRAVSWAEACAAVKAAIK